MVACELAIQRLSKRSACHAVACTMLWTALAALAVSSALKLHLPSVFDLLFSGAQANVVASLLKGYNPNLSPLFQQPTFSPPLYQQLTIQPIATQQVVTD